MSFGACDGPFFFNIHWSEWLRTNLENTDLIHGIEWRRSIACIFGVGLYAYGGAMMPLLSLN